MSYKLIFLANNIIVNLSKFGKNIITPQEILNHDSSKPSKDEILNSLSKKDRFEILKIKKLPNLFDKMANLIAPSILGNLEIKKGILLMLFGGVQKTTRDKMKIRGDLNLCLVGDPSTAKS